MNKFQSCNYSLDAAASTSLILNWTPYRGTLRLLPPFFLPRPSSLAATAIRPRPAPPPSSSRSPATAHPAPPTATPPSLCPPPVDQLPPELSRAGVVIKTHPCHRPRPPNLDRAAARTKPSLPHTVRTAPYAPPPLPSLIAASLPIQVERGPHTPCAMGHGKLSVLNSPCSILVL
jgi:hypothetical protein